MGITERIRNSQIFVAICATMLGAESCLIAGIKPMLLPLSAIFLSTLFIYNASRLTLALSGIPDKKNKIIFIQGDYRNIALSLISFLSLFFVLTQCNETQVLIFMITALLSLAYMMPFSINGRKTKGLRNNVLIKNILLSIIWATATVWFPLAGSKILDFGQELLFMFIRRFFFIYALTTIFDIKDIVADTKSGLQTFVLKFGINESKLWASASLLMFCTAILFDPYLNNPAMLQLSLALYISAVFTALIIAGTTIERNKSYYSFVIDGAMAIQFILVLIFSTTLF